MNDELECLETQSEIARVRARANHCCELCGVKNFAIGGRDSDGTFRPLYQAHADPVEARSKIGQLAWCGLDKRESVCRIFRVVCDVVTVEDHMGAAPMLICKRCIGIIRKRTTLVVAA